MKSIQPRQRGRPRTDVAHSLRNRLWAWEVRDCFGMSWDNLDAEFLPASGAKDAHRHRAFWNIAHFGLEPRSSMRLQRKVDLVPLVAARPGAAYTRDLYESPLWEMLASPGVAAGRLVELKQVLLERRGLFQASGAEVEAGRWVFPKARAFRKATPLSRRRGIARLVKSATLDDIALLVIQLRFAMALVELDEAKDYFNALFRAFEVQQRKKPPQRHVLYSALQALVRARLVLGDWSDEDPSYFNLSLRVRRKHPRPPQKHLLPPDIHSRLMSTTNFTKQLSARRANMVPIDSRVRWFQKHREAILHDRAVIEWRWAFTEPVVAKRIHIKGEAKQKKFLLEMRAENPPAPYEELARWGLPPPDGYEVE